MKAVKILSTTIVFCMTVPVFGQLLPIEAQRNAAAPRADTAVAPGEQSTGVVDPNTYKIGAEDGLRVAVWGNPNLSSTPKVRSDGMISLPMIEEDVQVAGLTVNQARALLVKLYGSLVVAPSIMVDVVSPMSRRYLLSGQFSRTGSFPLLRPMRVSDAIVESGGFQPFANEKNVKIVRGNTRFKFNYKDWIKGKNPEQNRYLEPGDILIAE